VPGFQLHIFLLDSGPFPYDFLLLLGIWYTRNQFFTNALTDKIDGKGTKDIRLQGAEQIRVGLLILCLFPPRGRCEYMTEADIDGCALS